MIIDINQREAEQFILETESIKETVAKAQKDNQEHLSKFDDPNFFRNNLDVIKKLFQEQQEYSNIFDFMNFLRWKLLEYIIYFDEEKRKTMTLKEKISAKNTLEKDIKIPYWELIFVWELENLEDWRRLKVSRIVN